MPLINFSGLASGIDSEALIKATSDATRATRVTPKKNKITQLEDTNEAFGTLDTKLSAIKGILDDFTTALGGPLTKKTSSSDSDLVTATATNAASDGNYQITVLQKAKNATLSLKSNATYSSTSDVLGAVSMVTPDADRTVTIEIGTGSDQVDIDIVVTDTMTVSDFATQFNEQTTKALASVVNVGTPSAPDYRIVITSTNVGESEGQLNIVSGAEIAAQNIFNDNLLSGATNSQFTISGIGSGGGGAATIERSTNTITDVLPGITLNLVDADPLSPVTITVSNDNSATSTKIQSFVTAFNELVEFIAESNKIERVENGDKVSNVFGPMASTRIDDNALQAIRTAIVGSSYDDGSEVRIFADFGITTDRDGTLKFDSSKMQTALETEPNSVNEIIMAFSDTAALTDGAIDNYTRFGGIISTAKTANTDQIKSLNEQIARVEDTISKQETAMRRRFATLEQTVSRMQSQQSALTSALASLSS